MYGLQTSHASPAACRDDDPPIADDGDALTRQASDPEVIVLSAEEEPDQAAAAGPTPFATPDASPDEGALAEEESMASRQPNPSSNPSAGAATGAAAEGSVRKRGHASSQALCSTSEPGAGDRKRRRVGACSSSSIAGLVAAGWRGTGLPQGPGEEPCMALALDTWPGPEEPCRAGSLGWLGGLAPDAYPALLQIECEVISVVSAYCAAPWRAAHLWVDATVPACPYTLRWRL